MTEASGAGAVAAVLERLGVSHVFGMPGTQNIDLFEAIRSRSGVRAVLCAHELGAAFMANGYFRACGKPAVVLTVPGAGLAYALAGLAEAKLDSAALLHIVCTGEEQTAGRPRAESLDEAAMAATVVKESFDLVDAETIGEVIAKAHRACMAGEPGPVMLRIADEVLRAERPAAGVDASAPARALPDAGAGAEVTSLLAAARRPLLFVGQGAVAAAEGVQRLAEQHGAALLTTTSGRGIVPEDHRLALAFDFLHHDIAELNRLVAACDLVIALGCKLSSNGTGGYALELPRDRLVTINSASGVNEDRYPARIAVQARAEDWVEAALDTAHADDEVEVAGGWSADEIAGWRGRFNRGLRPAVEPKFHGAAGSNAAGFFDELRRAMPREAILVTDSGLHQVLSRRHFEVLAPRGFIVPSDFQSMGFGIPAAIGARLAAPERPVVGLVGDGGLIMAGLELLTAVRERVPVTLIVFNDGQLNLIRLQQLSRYGRATAVKLVNPDLEAFAASVGADYVSFEHDGVDALAAAVRRNETSIVEVRLGDGPALRTEQAKGTARRVLGATARRRLRRLLPRR